MKQIRDAVSAGRPDAIYDHKVETDVWQRRKLQPYRGIYIDLSSLPNHTMAEERKRLKERYSLIRLLYGRISFQVYSVLPGDA